MTQIIGPALPQIPWQEKPVNVTQPLWRYGHNPVIGRDGNAISNSVFNSAVVPYQNGFAGVFRCDSRAISMDLFAGFSRDGLSWQIEDTPICLGDNEAEVLKREYRYDARVCYMEGHYYVSWCNGYHGPTIGLAWTDDFKTFHQLENALLPYNRNGVLFPRKIQDRYMLLSRPSDTGHTPFGDIFVSQSEDLIYWGRHRYMMGAVKGDRSAWQSMKIGPGPVPIETDEGWLLIYHGVINTCNGYVYRMGAALLDIDQPWRVLHRSRNYILAPNELYECVGDVPNVVFPCAALADSQTGRIAIYYGCADTVTGLAFTTVDTLVQYIKDNDFQE
ncbi:MAG: glycoside hydrolase family 130 protein [Oscillospiraceae bacterium]|nr:glycoside hydrolase family 130 protein [Oscillospiraceae bacterium]MDD4369033.1 glycoside hydrolase family 130 protein [Oscillospiraceae bacterium]